MSSRKNVQSKRALTIAAAAEYACVSRGTLHNWIVTGLLPFEELPGCGDGSHKFRLIRRQDLDEFLDRYYSQPKPAKTVQPNPGRLILLRNDA